MKRVFAVGISFTLGISIACTWAAWHRRAPATSAPPGRPALKVLTRPTHPHAPEEPATPAPTGDDPLAAIDGRLREERDHAREDIRNVATWDDFYAVTRSLNIQDFQLEDLILQRVGRELGLPRERMRSLQALLNEEQIEVTKAAVDRHGNSLLTLFSLKGEAAKPIWDDIHQTRQAVRATFETRYLTLLSPEQADVFNRHLRNDYARLYRTTTVNEPDQILIIGAGRNPSGS